LGVTYESENIEPGLHFGTGGKRPEQKGRMEKVTQERGRDRQKHRNGELTADYQGKKKRGFRRKVKKGEKVSGRPHPTVNSFYRTEERKGAAKRD